MIGLKKWVKSKIEKRYITSIAISIIIIFLVIGNIININYRQKEPMYMAEKGVLDLRNWDLEGGKRIKLNGQWEFYPGRLIQPNEGFQDRPREYIKVPDSWESDLKSKDIGNESGTYRLVVKVPEDRIYAIKARTIRLSNRVYFNGEEVAHVGNPSLDKKNFRAGIRYNVGVGNSVDGEVEIIVHVTSLNYKFGGIVQPIELGTVDSIMIGNNISLALDAIGMTVCLSLGLYFLAICMQRRGANYLAYFSGTNFFMALYLSTMNEQILRLVFDYNFITRTRIQILAMVMGAVCFIQFMHHFFKEQSNRKITNRITCLTLFTLFVLLNNPEKTISISQEMAQLILISVMAVDYSYIFYILIKAIDKKAEFLGYIIVVATSIFTYWLTLLIKTYIEIDLGHTPIIIILLMMFSIAALLSHRVQLDHEKANKLSEKLTRYDRLMDDFLVKSSHKLKIPLEIILNATINLLEGKRGALNTKQQEGLFLIHQEGKRIRILVNDLLDASLIKKGKLKLRLTSIEPYEVIENILKEIRVLTPLNEDVVIKNQVPKDFPPIRADSDKFRQIIYDLIHNGIKYTKSGEIVISACLVQGQAEITVKDTGIGIEENHINEIFDIFYKRDEEGEGLGLGLSIVKHLVENQGGKIMVQSTYGQGSTFSITLPLSAQSRKEEKELSQGENSLIRTTFDQLSSTLEEKQQNPGKPRILIIEDEPLNQTALSEVLRELNYNTIIANSGQQALDLMEYKKVDLIILDFMLDGMTSSELCNKIRQRYSMVELPILVLTASGRTIDLMTTFNYGVNDFQKKPVDTKELKSRIQSLLLIKASAEEGLEKEFQYFYSQISPHFLYNTLNSIIGLSFRDSEKVRKALSNLSVYLRGKLDIHRKKGLVTLESELEIVIAYLEIEELRYSQRLAIEYNIEEGLDALIPSLTLQPIIENSVHHGISTMDRGGKIKISTKKEQKGFISIIIEDNGVGMTLEDQEKLLMGNGNGIGFKNVMERIKMIKGATLELESKLDEGTKVKITLPEAKFHENNFS